MFGITAVSSSGIVAKVLADLGRLGNRETPSVLGILVLEDLGMAVYLPILTAVLAASGVWEATGSVLIALACLAVALVVALRWGSVISKFVSGGSGEVTLLRVLGLALLVAGVAEQLHVSAAVGAFLLGISLSERPRAGGAPPPRTAARPVRGGLLRLLRPVHRPQLAAPRPAARPRPRRRRRRHQARDGVGGRPSRGHRGPRPDPRGAALIPRGEFSIVIAGLATAAGVDARLAALAAAYVLVMAVLGPVLARFADPWARAYVRRQREKAATTAR